MTSKSIVFDYDAIADGLDEQGLDTFGRKLRQQQRDAQSIDRDLPPSKSDEPIFNPKYLRGQTAQQQTQGQPCRQRKPLTIPYPQSIHSAPIYRKNIGLRKNELSYAIVLLSSGDVTFSTPLKHAFEPNKTIEGVRFWRTIIKPGNMSFAQRYGLPILRELER